MMLAYTRAANPSPENLTSVLKPSRVSTENTGPRPTLADSQTLISYAAAEVFSVWFSTSCEPTGAGVTTLREVKRMWNSRPELLRICRPVDGGKLVS